MADDDIEFNQFIGRLLKSIEEIESTLVQKKRLVNEVCHEYGRPPHFTDIESPRSRSIGSLKRDQFYGKPLATAIREFLEMRGPSDRGGLGAASVNEIYSALSDGGFKFETKNEQNSKRGLRIALSKNTITFHRVGESYGLLEWYPNARAPKPTLKASTSEMDDEDASAAATEEDARVRLIAKGR